MAPVRKVAAEVASAKASPKPASKAAPSKPAPGKPAAGKPAPGKAAQRNTPGKAAQRNTPGKAAQRDTPPSKPAPSKALPSKVPATLRGTSDAPVTPSAAPPATPKRVHSGRAGSPAAASPTPKATEAPETSQRAPRSPAKLSGGIAVVKVLDSKQPVEALRKFLARIPGDATTEQGQIALGSAQLMLLPIAHEHRGGDEVKQLLDLVLARWQDFPDRSGFHAQEFLRNAFAAVGDDRERIEQLAALVPREATSELRLNMACAYAVIQEQPAMLRALEMALSAGATAAQIRRDPDFAAYLDDPAMIALLDRAAVPTIPVNIAPYVAPVRAALNALVATLSQLGENSRLNPPATIDAIISAERARQLQLPNDYRALLTITDGMAIWDHEFFGTSDYRGDTPLAKRARAFLEMSVSYGGIGMDECVPLANWGQPNNWLLYDPRGSVREGDPGYVVMLTADPWPMNDLADALRKIESSVRDALGTN